METSISTFPIIIQSQPGHGHRHDESMFVRAHVMQRYHRQRKLGNRSTKTSIPQDTGKKVHGQDDRTTEVSRPGKSRHMEVSAGFIEYVASAISNHRVPRFSNVRKDYSPVALPTRIDNLQLDDPREQEWSKFTLIFDTCKPVFLHYLPIWAVYLQNPDSHLLEERRTLLDPLSKAWIPAAFTDLALFHAILFNFSQHLYALCSMDHEKPSLLGHKVSALRQISARMESPSEACADPIIASILCLVSHEVSVRSRLTPFTNNASY
jgi:hypothetical protein